MEIYRNLSEVRSIGGDLVVALGNFDGVHLGHQQLLRELMMEAKDQGAKGVVFTFEPHPLKLLNPDLSPPLLLTLEEKVNKISALGIDALILNPFTLEFANLSPEDFVRTILVQKLKVKGVLVGWNYNFGQGGKGNTDTLTTLGEKYNFRVKILPPVTSCGDTVSSTLIRELLQQGQVEKATQLLGYRPYYRGPVVHGEARGRTLGFPTANLEISSDLIVPKRGVYAVNLYIGPEICQGVANIGVKPTFHEKGMQPNLEVNIFDFNGDIYGEEIKVELVELIREEKKFTSLDQLKHQLLDDCQSAKAILDHIYIEI